MTDLNKKTLKILLYIYNIICFEKTAFVIETLESNDKEKVWKEHIYFNQTIICHFFSSFCLGFISNRKKRNLETYESDGVVA